MHADPTGFAAMWVLMSVVMMAPTVSRPARRLAQGSATRRIGFLAGYTAVWLLAGVPAFAVVSAISGSLSLVLLCGVLVGVWQTMPITTSLLRRCQGLTAHGSIVMSGMRQGVWCVASCGPLMVVAMAALHVLDAPVPLMFVTMAALAGLTMWERQPRVPVAAIRVVGVVLVIGCAMAFVFAGDGAAHHVMAA